MPDWSTFERRLEWAIENAPESREELAAKLGTASTRFPEWTHRRRRPSLKYMLQFPGVLGVDGHWLLTGEGSPEPKENIGWKLSEIERVIEARPLP